MPDPRVQMLAKAAKVGRVERDQEATGATRACWAEQDAVIQVDRDNARLVGRGAETACKGSFKGGEFSSCINVLGLAVVGEAAEQPGALCAVAHMEGSGGGIE